MQKKFEYIPYTKIVENRKGIKVVRFRATILSNFRILAIYPKILSMLYFPKSVYKLGWSIIEVN